eukprot:10894025-Prorocentrum_lima.AAC.1
MNGEWGPGTPLDDGAEMDRSGAASETPAVQRRLHAVADMRSVATPLLLQAQFGRWSPPEA